MTELPSVPLWCIYLLHFDAPVEGQTHYVGRCAAPRLGDRMIEHTTGRGAKLTAAACKAEIGWRLARTFWSILPDHEAVIEQIKDHPSICPICAGTPGLQRFQPTKKARTVGAGLDLSKSSLPKQLLFFTGPETEKDRTSVKSGPFPIHRWQH